MYHVFVGLEMTCGGNKGSNMGMFMNEIIKIGVVNLNNNF